MKIHFHKWRTFRTTGVTNYDRCVKCDKKRITQLTTGDQSIDFTWLGVTPGKVKLKLYGMPPGLVHKVWTT